MECAAAAWRFALFGHVMWAREGQLEQTVPNEWISIGGDGSNTIGEQVSHCNRLLYWTLWYLSIAHQVTSLSEVGPRSSGSY